MMLYQVLCENFDDFIEDLSAHISIFENTIRYSFAVEPEGNRVHAQASALVYPIEKEHPPYLLQVGLFCGKDYIDSDKKEGTEKAEEYRQRLIQYAEVRDWKVLPGIITF